MALPAFFRHALFALLAALGGIALGVGCSAPVPTTADDAQELAGWLPPKPWPATFKVFGRAHRREQTPHALTFDYPTASCRMSAPLSKEERDENVTLTAHVDATGKITVEPIVLSVCLDPRAYAPEVTAAGMGVGGFSATFAPGQFSHCMDNPITFSATVTLTDKGPRVYEDCLVTYTYLDQPLAGPPVARRVQGGTTITFEPDPKLAPPPCGGGLQPACSPPDPPCQPGLEGSPGYLCTACGSHQGQRPCRGQVCDPGLVPSVSSADTGRCTPCGKNGLPGCGRFYNQCEAGTVAVNRGGKPSPCTPCGKDNQFGCGPNFNECQAGFVSVTYSSGWPSSMCFAIPAGCSATAYSDCVCLTSHPRAYKCNIRQAPWTTSGYEETLNCPTPVLLPSGQPYLTCGRYVAGTDLVDP